MYSIIGVAPKAFRHPGRGTATDVEVWAPAGWLASPFPAQPIRRAYVLQGGLGRLKAGVTPAARAAARSTRSPRSCGSSIRPTIRRRRLGAARHPAARRSGRRRASRAADAARRGRLRAAHRLRERREPAARALVGAAARDRDPPRARRRPRAPRAPAAHRERAARGGRRRARPAGRGLGRRRARAAEPVEPAAPARRSASTATVLAFTAGAVDRDRRPLRSRAGDSGIARRPAVGDARGERARRARAGRSTRLRSVLVVGEFALALVLLVGAALLVQSFWRLQRVDLGFNPSSVLTARLWLPQPNDPQTRSVLHARRAGAVLPARARARRRAARRRRRPAASPACRSAARRDGRRSASKGGAPDAGNIPVVRSRRS